MKIEFYKREKLDKIIKKKIKNTNIVLDIGCGIRPQTFITPIVHICAEPFYQYVEKLQEIKNKSFDRNFLIIKSTWEETIKLLPSDSVDTIFILDVIEHLEKKDGENLLKATEKIARKQIILFTPLGFLYQKDNKKDAWGMDGVDWQEHKSGWTPNDFDDSWDIYASEKYHFLNNKNEKLEKPFGAFYAIKNKKIKEKTINIVAQKYSLITNLFFIKTIRFFNKCIYLFKEIKLKSNYLTK